MEHNNNEFNLSSQGPIYEEFMDALNNEIDGQQQAKEKIIKEILNLNHDLSHDSDTLRTIILSGPEENQKLKMLETIAKLLFGGKNYLIRHDFRSNPNCNPLTLIDSVAINPVEKDSLEDKDNKIQEEEIIAYYEKSTLEAGRYHAQEQKNLHKISQKRPGLSLIYFDNIDCLEKQTRQNFFNIMYNTKKITYKNIQYDIDLSNSIVFFGFNKKENKEMGFAHKSAIKDIKTIIADDLGSEFLEYTDKIIEFPRLELEHVNNYIQRLANNFQSRIHTKNNIKINYTPELIEAFKNEDLRSIDQTTKNIERKRKLVEEKVSSFITKIKKTYTDNPQENQIILSVDPNDKDSIVGKTIPYNHSDINTND